MQIRMTVQMPEGATRNGEPWPAEGETVDLPLTEASHLVAAGVAEAVTEDDGQVPVEPRGRRRKAEPEGEG